MSELTWKYVKTLGDSHAVEAFLEENNLSLPKDLIVCLKNNNGARPNRKTFDTERSKEHMIKTMLSFNHGDNETVYSAFSALRKNIRGSILCRLQVIHSATLSAMTIPEEISFCGCMRRIGRRKSQIHLPIF